MPSDELKTHAASSQDDFYELFDISPAAQDSEIRRAYRRAALKYHPDKITNPTPADIEKFHLVQVANDVLSDPTVRQLYDNAREARLRRKREMDMLDATKRKMREDLEARERAGAAAPQRGVKRTWMTATGGGDDTAAEDRLQKEIERIAEDGRRRRREAEDRLRREMAEEEKIMQQEQEEEQRAADRSNHRVDRSREGGGANVGMLERSVKVHWVKEDPRRLAIDKDRLASLFGRFGKIEDVFTLKDKKQRIGDRREKKLMGTGVVVYSSIVSAHAAVLDSEKRIRQKTGLSEGDWALIDNVSWASGNAPDLNGPAPVSSPSSPPSSSSTVPPPPSRSNPPLNTSPSKPSFNFSGIKSHTPREKTPSFTSFSPVAANSAKSSSPDEQTKRQSAPSFQELTFMRLRNAQREKEQRALEEELRREDEAADAAEAAATNVGNA